MSVHHVYINDLPVLFVPLRGSSNVQFGKGFLIVGEEDMTPEGIYREMQSSFPPNGIIYLCENPDLKWEKFVSHFRLVEAAGGIVRNKDGKLLVIYRRGKWDLPKGKLDAGESPEQAAVREVEEECGVAALGTGPLIKCTYHTYTEKTENILKKTYWFGFTTDDGSGLIPQEEEGIEKAEWMTREEIMDTVYANTYRSVQSVFETYFSAD